MPRGVYPRTAEHCKHIARSRIGMKLSQEHCLNIGKSQLGKTRSIETKKNIQNALRGRTMNDQEYKDHLEGWKKKRGVALETTHKENCQCSFCKNKRKELKGENHPTFIKNVKAEDRYRLLHMRIIKMFGKANKCENKNCKKISNNFQWSSIDHEYTLNRKDWRMLCVRCHKEYDNNKRRTNESKKRIYIK